MNLRKKKTMQHGSTVIFGCGRLGALLASTLSEKGETVTIVDRNKDSFRKLSPSFSGLTIIGNATDLDILTESKIDEDTTAVFVTNSGNTNIMAAQMAKVIYGAGRVIARLYDPEKACVYQEQHIETICPATLAAEAINAVIEAEDTHNRSDDFGSFDENGNGNGGAL